MRNVLQKYRLLISIVIVLVTSGGIAAGVYLVQKNQDIKERAQEDCSYCDGQITRMTLRFLGNTQAQVRVVQKADSDVVFDGHVFSNEEFSISGTWKRDNTLSTEITIYVNNEVNTKIHTSCSDPNVAPGAIYGSFLIVAAESRNGGNICPTIPIPTLIPSPTPEPTVTPTLPVISPSITPTGTPIPTPTMTPMPTTAPTNTPIPTPTDTPRSIPSPTPSPTPTSEPTATPTLPVRSPSPTATPTDTPTRSSSPTPTSEPTSDYACLGDRVVIDSNRDSIQNAGESGLGGVTIQCYDSNDNLITSTVTNSEGFYEICNLVPGSYYVKFSLPSGYAFSERGVGSDSGKDSDVYADTQKTQLVSLKAGDNDITIDALVYVLGMEIESQPTQIPSAQPTQTAELPDAGVGLYTTALLVIGLILVFISISILII